MKNKQLNKALELVSRTGDKILVMDQESDKVFALMDLDEYEFLLDHDSELIENYNEEEMFNKLDRDLKHWREYHEEDEGEKEDESFVDLNSIDEQDGLDNLSDLEENEEWSEEPVGLNEDLNLVTKEEEPLNIVPLNKDNGQPLNILKEEDLDGLKEDDPEEADKFYLEPVE